MGALLCQLQADLLGWHLAFRHFHHASATGRDLAALDRQHVDLAIVHPHSAAMGNRVQQALEVVVHVAWPAIRRKKLHAHRQPAAKLLTFVLLEHGGDGVLPVLPATFAD